MFCAFLIAAFQPHTLTTVPTPRSLKLDGSDVGTTGTFVTTCRPPSVNISILTKACSNTAKPSRSLGEGGCELCHGKTPATNAVRDTGPDRFRSTTWRHAQPLGSQGTAITSPTSSVTVDQGEKGNDRRAMSQSWRDLCRRGTELAQRSPNDPTRTADVQANQLPLERCRGELARQLCPRLASLDSVAFPQTRSGISANDPWCTCCGFTRTPHPGQSHLRN